MADSKAEVYLHFIWSTKNRQPSIAPIWEAELHRVMASEAQKSGCTMIASGGTADHVHLLLKLGRSVTIAKLMNQIKGSASHFVNHTDSNGHPRNDNEFEWQNGYYVLSVTPSHIHKVIEYIHNQKQHHATQTLYPQWEITEDPSDSNSR